MRFTAIFIFSVVLTNGGSMIMKAFTYELPCMGKSDEHRSEEFVRRHIIQEKFHTYEDWARYLENNHLCGRVSVQSFIETRQDVNAICSNNGRRLDKAGKYAANLCISTQPMEVYDVSSEMTNKVCKVSRVDLVKRYVTVACDRVGESCLPVHYENDKDKKQSNVPCKGVDV